MVKSQQRPLSMSPTPSSRLPPGSCSFRRREETAVRPAARAGEGAHTAARPRYIARRGEAGRLESGRKAALPEHACAMKNRRIHGSFAPPCPRRVAQGEGRGRQAQAGFRARAEVQAGRQALSARVLRGVAAVPTRHLRKHGNIPRSTAARTPATKRDGVNNRMPDGVESQDAEQTSLRFRRPNR